ncbi:MAG: hypothetical protein LBP22_00615 [Deltaproteobacteria bacterium]|jgi:chromosome segregation ATPase|nr:hypothetical protein [Deltaproteobacteria bacterium]
MVPKKQTPGWIDQDLSQNWEMEDPKASELAQYQAGDKLDIPKLTALAREFSKALANFRPPEGYRPEPALTEPTLTPAMARALGAPSLSEYFLKTLKAKDPAVQSQSSRSARLPRGPESVPGALKAVTETLEGYEAADQVGYKKIIALLASIKSSLGRAQSLGKELALESELWRTDSLDKYNKAKKLAEAVKLLLVSPEAVSENIGVALTSLTQTLTERLAETRTGLEGRRRWQVGLRLFQEELESLQATVNTGSALNFDWTGQFKILTERLSEFEQKHQELLDRRQETDRRLSSALADLEKAESNIVGENNKALLTRGEALAKSIDSLWRFTLQRRSELAEFWLNVAPLVGRPVFLDKIFLYTATNLGRTQGLLEEQKTNLSQVVGRLSSTRDLRRAAKEALKVKDKARRYPALLDQSSRWLENLKNLVREKKNSELISRELAQQTELNRYLKVRLAEKEKYAAGDGTLSDLAEQLGAVASERDRLKEELLGLKAKLSESGQTKAELMKLVEWAKRSLKEVAHERSLLQSQLNKNHDELSLLRRRHTRLTEQFNHSQKQYKELTGTKEKNDAEIKKQLEERQQLSLKLGEYEDRIRDLAQERQTLSIRQQELALSLDQVRGQEAALAAELAGHQEELAEATRARENLGQIITGYRRQLDRLIVAHRVLMESWHRRGLALAQSEQEREEQKIKLDRQNKSLIAEVTKRQKLLAELGTSRLQLESLESERQRLNQEIEAARSEAERIQNTVQDSQVQSQKALETALANENRLNEELKNLQNEIDYNLKPLIEILGLALWQGEAANRKSAEAQAGELKKFVKNAGAREAGIRIQSANREIDYLERLGSQEKEIEKLKAEKDALETEHHSLLEKGTGRSESSSEDGWVVSQLSLALAASDLRQEKLRRGLKDFKIRLATQKTEAAGIKAELEELTKNQAEALKNHKAWLSELVPLVGFFLQEGLDFWTMGPGKNDARQAVLYFLREENLSLAAELEKFREERQSLWAERQTLLEIQAGFKEHLNELKPLVGFLIRQFVDNAVSLAQAWNQRDILLSEMASLHAVNKTGQPISSLSAALGERHAELQKTLGKIRDLEEENAALKGQVDLATGEVENQRKRALELDAAKEEAFVKLGRQIKEAKSLTAEFKTQAEEYNKVRTEASRLTAENQRLAETADRQAEELAKRQAEISALNDSPRKDGKLEAAWAALNYLGTRSADSLATLQAKLDQQARQMEEAFRQLRLRDAEIKTLENRQDTLAILYWTVVQMSAEGQLSLPKVPERQALPAPEAESEEDEGREISTKPAKKAGEKGLFGSGLLAEIRKAARKSIFSLFIAGGLVLYLPAAGQAEPLQLGGPETPIVRSAVSEPLRPTACFNAGPMMKKPAGFRPLGHFSGEVSFPVAEINPYEPGPLATRMFCRTLNRTIDLGFLSLEERQSGQTESQAIKFLARRAKSLGLEPAAMLRLVRGAFDRDKTVFLSDLNGEEASFTLMRPYFPQMTRTLHKAKFKDILGYYLLPSLDGLSKSTAQFWDRLFMDFYHRTADLEEAAMGLAFHLSRRLSLKNQVEFGGQLGPVKELEKLPVDIVIPILAEYIRLSWPGFPSPKKRQGPEDRLAFRLAEDLHSAGQVFGLPWTFLVPVAQEMRASGALWPSSLDIYSGVSILKTQVEIFSRKWSETRLALCDLDLLVARWSAPGVQEIYKKKAALVNFFSQSLQNADRLFD